MGRNNSKTIAVIALMVAIVGLSLGFAALNSTLTITSKARVSVPDAAWKVGLSNVSTGIPTTSQTVTGTPESTNGTLTLAALGGSIAQTENAEARLTTSNGSSVTYSFYVVNEGDLDAYLNDVHIGTLSCKTVANNTAMDSTDCNRMFEATLTVGENSNAVSVTTTGNQQVNTNIGDKNKLVKKSGTTYAYAPVTLTISYRTDSINSVTNTIVDEDFYVELSSSTIYYTPRTTGSGS